MNHNLLNNKLSRNLSQAFNKNYYTFDYNDNKTIPDIFHKSKKEYYSFEPNPVVEEIPTFTFENERNLSNYKSRIYNKNTLIEQNSKKYLEYIKKFERKKASLSSPYSVYQEITKKNFNNYNTEINNNANNINTINNNINGEWNENYSNKYWHNNTKEKSLSSSLSAYNIVFDRKNNEITNPDLFYKRNNNDYFKYREEQKKYLDYNYQIMINKSKFHHKQEPNVNPYNPKHEDFEHYKSDLAHNTILNPVNYYSYNKYLEKEIKENNQKCNNNYINNYIYKGLSSFQKVGNQLINN